LIRIITSLIIRFNIGTYTIIHIIKIFRTIIIKGDLNKIVLKKYTKHNFILIYTYTYYSKMHKIVHTLHIHNILVLLIAGVTQRNVLQL